MALVFRPYLGIAVLLGLSASCFSKEVGAADTSLREHLLHSAVRIRYERIDGTAIVTGHGTAFSVDLSRWGYVGSRYLLSAAHNVLDNNGRPFSTLKVEIEGSEQATWTRCRVLAVDKELDLCLVESNRPVLQQTVLAAGDEAVGHGVMLAGSPRGIPIALYDGILTKRFESGSVRSSASLPFDHGCSGGPFFNAKGEVIGVAVAGVRQNDDMNKNIGLFVPLAGVTSFLDNNRASPVTAIAATLGTQLEPSVRATQPTALAKREWAEEMPAGSTQHLPKPIAPKALGLPLCDVVPMD